MIDAISKIITNPTLVNVAQSTNGIVISKTVVNSIGRPGFILIDSHIDEDTKKFAAMKEFLYQAACLAVYMALIVPVFKNGAFKLAKKYVYKGSEGFNKFKNAKEYLEYRKYAEITMQERSATINKIKLNNEELKSDLLIKKTPEKYNNIKGAIELGSLIGSITGLAIIAPQVSQSLTHTVLKLVGLEKK